MKFLTRLARLEKTLPKPEPGLGRAPAWFADKVLVFCRHLYQHAGLDPDAARLPPLEKTDRIALRGLLNTGFCHFRKAHGRKVTAEEFALWWPKGGCP
jgi:hypothetical protein